MGRMKQGSYRRKLKFTREGKYYVFLAFGVGFAAINTGNNLLYLILGMMLSQIVGSGILSELTIRRLRVSRHLPRRIFAKQPVLVGIRVRNEKQRFPTFAIEIEDLSADKSDRKRCFFLRIPARASQNTSYEHNFRKRGVYHLSSFKITTRFPFSLFAKSRRLEAPEKVIVYPELVSVDPQLRTYRNLGNLPQPRLGRAGDFHALRGYREGDDHRTIFWRKSTRGRLLVRQHEDPRSRQITIFLDNHRSPELTNDTQQRIEAEEHARASGSFPRCPLHRTWIHGWLFISHGQDQTARGARPA